ncbi:Protein of unknown function DUF229 [Carpediemonas membranifera]|uniref:Uncharacterized protein n=1 Tax=Carpediemonas membranifera TaxID=201153 RepID=A0A8J6AQU8_9EUKA|nr:Protein of unknown function DUF229 [Carpediemonas membranifera]|eukprot:KAG9391906.1 Protein of unknown function DUF229 [Carpediemonas membranifera]
MGKGSFLRVCSRIALPLVSMTALLCLCSVLCFYSFYLHESVPDLLLANSKGASDPLYPKFNDTVPLIFRNHSYDVHAAFGAGLTAPPPEEERGARVIASSIRRHVVQSPAPCSGHKSNLVRAPQDDIIIPTKAGLIYAQHDNIPERKHRIMTDDLQSSPLESAIAVRSNVLVTQILRKSKMRKYNTFQLMYHMPDFEAGLVGKVPADPASTEGFKHVAMIMIDSTSRANFNRQLPDVVSYLQSLGDLPVPYDLYSFPFLSVVGTNSQPNQQAMFTGALWDDKRRTLLWEAAREQGWTTGIFSQCCGDDVRMYFVPNYDDWDVAMTGFACDPIFEALSHCHQTGKVCNGAEGSFAQQARHALDFHERVDASGQRAFTYIPIEEAHNGNSLFRLGYIQPELLLLIQTLVERGDTAVVLASDHGLHYGRAYASSQVIWEHRNPHLSVLVPMTWSDTHAEEAAAMAGNERVLLGMRDIFSSLVDLLGLDVTDISQYHEERSVLHPMPFNRTCADAGISDYWCRFHPEPITILDTTAPAVWRIAQLVVDDVNKVTEAHRDVCGLHTLAKVYEAYSFVRDGNTHLKLTLATRPYKFFFMANIVFPGVGDLSRLRHSSIKYAAQGGLNDRSCSPKGVNPCMCSCVPAEKTATLLGWTVDWLNERFREY